jgi:hypothetical protein
MDSVLSITSYGINRSIDGRFLSHQPPLFETLGCDEFERSNEVILVVSLNSTLAIWRGKRRSTEMVPGYPDGLDDPVRRPSYAISAHSAYSRVAPLCPAVFPPRLAAWAGLGRGCRVVPRAAHSHRRAPGDGVRAGEGVGKGAPRSEPCALVRAAGRQETAGSAYPLAAVVLAAPGGSRRHARAP